ncbi:MAG: hypothetical protein ABI206_16570 [Antricoccus sp.]
MTTQRQQGQGLLANALAASGSLKPGLKEEDAADITDTLMSPRSIGCSSTIGDRNLSDTPAGSLPSSPIDS